MYQPTRKEKAYIGETKFITHKKGRETNIDRAKMAEVSKVITEKQDDPWNGEKPGQDTKKKQQKNLILPIVE